MEFQVSWQWTPLENVSLCLRMHARCYSKLNCPENLQLKSAEWMSICASHCNSKTIHDYSTFPCNQVHTLHKFFSLYPDHWPIQSFTGFGCLQRSSHLKRWKPCHFHIFERYFPVDLIQLSPSEDQTGGSWLNLWLFVVASVRRRRTLRPWPSIGWSSNHSISWKWKTPSVICQYCQSKEGIINILIIYIYHICVSLASLSMMARHLIRHYELMDGHPTRFNFSIFTREKKTQSNAV